MALKLKPASTDRLVAHRTMFRSVTLCALCLGTLSANCLAQTSPTIDFNRMVLPILSKNCFPCHGPDVKSRQAELRLDLRETALRTEKPVIVPGRADASLVIQRITSEDTETRMPPVDSPRQLTSHEIEILRRWVNEGATWTEHWSFMSVNRPSSPHVRDSTWSSSVIDDFILERLEQDALRPSPAAAGETLLRRAYLDLIGIPPTIRDRAEFLADVRPDAYERVVDRLLASPQFGERWGRHWLDAARYADSTGFETDAPRSMWKYRDWVFNALNADMSFDQFLIRQIAGDLLPGASVDDRVATGFLLNSQQDGGSEPARLDAVVDRVNTLGTVCLGLTLGCAQCHSHKFDPVSQVEYYGLFAFVNSAEDLQLEFAAPEQIARRDALQAQLASLTAERTTYAEKIPKDAQKTDAGLLERSATIEQLSQRIPKFDIAQVIRVPATVRTTTTFLRGDYSQPGEAVLPHVPGILPSIPEGPRTRLELARWFVSHDQPLTPRVTVNRIWQQLFGRGLVETESDFGTQGARPTHPQLLDWIAADFMQHDWGTKRLLRTIVGSSVYRQASHRRDDLVQIDPDNRLLARQSRLRLEAEAVRDSTLAVCGLLSTKFGGPSVFPYQPEGIMLNRATPAPWSISPGEDRYRRGAYTHYWRLTPHPQLQTFDAPDAITACTRRQPATTPLQALTLLNDATFVEAAEAMARTVCEGDGDDTVRLTQVFEQSLARFASDDERQLFMEFLTETRKRFRSTASGADANVDRVEQTAWTQVVRTILNLEEFIVRE